MKNKRMSVIIPAYNAHNTMKECVESVLKNAYENFELIVVDDASADNTREILENIKDERLKCFFNSTNRGASYSRNYAIKESTGEIVLLLDSDAYVQKDWIENHSNAHDEIAADIIGGGIKGIHKTIYGKCDGFCNWWTSIPYSKSRYITKLHIPTINVSIKKDVFKRIGYFDEGLKTGEDADFCFRAVKNGLKIYFKSDVIIYHYDRNGFKEFMRHQEAWGCHALQMRKGRNMDFSWLMPDSYLTGCLALVPLAVLYTGFIIMKWLKYDLSVLLVLPIIFVGKIKHAFTIMSSAKTLRKSQDLKSKEINVPFAGKRGAFVNTR